MARNTKFRGHKLRITPNRKCIKKKKKTEKKAKKQNKKNGLLLFLKWTVIIYPQILLQSGTFLFFIWICISPEYTCFLTAIVVVVLNLLLPPAPPLSLLHPPWEQIKAVPYQTDQWTSRERLAILALCNKLSSTIGGCERLVQTPVPLHYVRHTSRFLTIWCFLLPLVIGETPSFLILYLFIYLFSGLKFNDFRWKPKIRIIVYYRLKTLRRNWYISCVEYTFPPYLFVYLFIYFLG